MFERFTDRARRVVVLAQDEARLLDHNYIGTEHILLGLIHEGEGVAARALESLDISLDTVRQEVVAIIGQGDDRPGGQHIPFTPRAKKVLELSLREALALGHNYIGTEHILLGLVREGKGVAAQVLAKLGGSLDRVRQAVVVALAGAGGVGPPEQASRIGQPPTVMVTGGPGVFQEQEPAELVRVVPLAREVHRGYGHRTVLISLEVWSGWLDVRFALLPEDPPAAPPVADVVLAWQVTDDLGTAYELTGLATSGGRRLRIHQLGFQPAPPAAASTLTLTATDPEGAKLAVVEIELAGEAG
jgi:Clp amino terminal domain, pathogenicity island component